MNPMRFRCRAVLGGIVAGSLAYLGTVLLNQGGIGMDTTNLAASIGAFAGLGAFMGAFGFNRGSQAWNDALDTMEETFSNG
jgi:hypothetical protein